MDPTTEGPVPHDLVDLVQSSRGPQEGRVPTDVVADPMSWREVLLLIRAPARDRDEMLDGETALNWFAAEDTGLVEEAHQIPAKPDLLLLVPGSSPVLSHDAPS